MQYMRMVAAGRCHQAGKDGPVNWNERLHSVLRSKLPRLVRRTKGYIKSIATLVYALTLVCQQLGAKPNASSC